MDAIIKKYIDNKDEQQLEDYIFYLQMLLRFENHIIRDYPLDHLKHEHRLLYNEGLELQDYSKDKLRWMRALE